MDDKRQKCPNTSLMILQRSWHGLLIVDFILVNCAIKQISEIPDSIEIMKNIKITIIMLSETGFSWSVVDF